MVEEGSSQSQMEERRHHLEVGVEVEENHLHLQVACMDCIWALGQQPVQTSWVAAVWTLKCWASQRNGWSPSVQAHGQGVHQCFWVAAKMGETLLESQIIALGTVSGYQVQQTAMLVPEVLLQVAGEPEGTQEAL